MAEKLKETLMNLKFDHQQKQLEELKEKYKKSQNTIMTLLLN